MPRVIEDEEAIEPGSFFAFFTEKEDALQVRKSTICFSSLFFSCVLFPHIIFQFDNENNMTILRFTPLRSFRCELNVYDESIFNMSVILMMGELIINCPFSNRLVSRYRIYSLTR